MKKIIVIILLVIGIQVPMCVYAAKNKDTLFGIQQVLAAGADVNAVDSHQIELRLAIQQNNLKKVQELLKAGAKFPNDLSQNESDILDDAINAINSERLEVIEQQKINAARLEVTEQQGINSARLKVTEWQNSIAMDKKLLEEAWQTEKKTLKKMQEKKEYGVKLLEAANCNNLLGVKEALAKEAILDQTDKHGWTALITAVHYRYLDIVKELLKAGADLDIKSDVGKIALQHAMSYNNGEIVKLVLKAKIKTVTDDEFEYIIAQLAQLDCKDPKTFLVGQEMMVIIDPVTGNRTEAAVDTLKAKMLKKAYEDYYKGNPEMLLFTVGDKERFGNFKEQYFTREFLQQLYREHEEAKLGYLLLAFSKKVKNNNELVKKVSLMTGVNPLGITIS